jgi:preprotein translocase subunit SecF
MFVIKHKNIFLGLSLLFVVISLVSIFTFGLTPGIDFVGGTLVEVSYTETLPDEATLASRLNELNLGAFSIRETGTDGVILRIPESAQFEKTALLNALSLDGQHSLIEERSTTIGPTIGKELQEKSYWAIGAILLIIILFVAFAFRKVSEPVSSWHYGLIAIITLAHDVIVPIGVFALLGHLYGAELDALFVTALLAILGYSVNDTIVVFDRVRENLLENDTTHTREDFEETIGKSLSQTFMRSLNTSITTVLVLLALVILGGSTIHNFVITLTAGIIAGTYSSLFFASPLLIFFAKKKK